MANRDIDAAILQMVMPSSTAAPVLAPNNRPSELPMPAPTASEGAKMPPGMPETIDSSPARNFSPKKNHGSGVPSTAPRACT